jgi:hypothetical protein
MRNRKEIQNKCRDDDQSIGPSHIVGDQSLEARIAEQTSHAARVRESMAHLRHCKTNLQSATEHNVVTNRSMSFEPTRTTRKAA